MAKFSETRLRSFDGFVALNDAKIDWLRANPSFSVYAKDIQIGRISREPQGTVVEVFVEDEKAYIEMLSANFDAILAD